MKTISIGDRVKLVSTQECGIVIHIWYDEKLETFDCYVAFFGKKFPIDIPKEKPYVLKYLTSSLIKV